MHEAAGAGWHVALWALDDVAPSLVPHTVGVGAGTKFELLGRLLEDRSTPGALVVADDDVEIVRGDLVTLLDWTVRADLDLAMPAHAPGSTFSYRFTGRQRWSRVRLTSFVESGPLFIIAARARPHLLPFPADVGMGWGIELHWRRASIERSLRLGIVDAVQVRHDQTIAADYDRGDAQAQLDERLAASSLTSLRDIMGTVAIWRPWHRRAPWR